MAEIVAAIDVATKAAKEMRESIDWQIENMKAIYQAMLNDPNPGAYAKNKQAVAIAIARKR